MKSRNNSVHLLAFNALAAAVYAALTMALGFMSYGGVQFRVAEVLCLLPFFFPGLSWGLFIGCLIANLMSPAGMLDVVFGSLTTLASCLCIEMLGKGEKTSWWRGVLACFCPVFFNALIVGAVLAFTLAEPGMAFGAAFVLFSGQIAFGELTIMLVLGLPLVRLLPKSRFFAQISEKINR